MTVNNSKKSWLELCTYVKKEILEYDSNMKFPKYLALKLQGLKRGEFIANNNHKAKANYDNETILLAFKLCKNKILNYLHNNENRIMDENHKINIIMKIVEPSINDVCIRRKRVETANNRVQQMDCKTQFNKNAGYSKKTKETNSKMKKLF